MSANHDAISKAAEPYEAIKDWSACTCGAKTKILNGQNFEVAGGYQEEGKSSVNLWDEHLCPAIKLEISTAIAAAIAEHGPDYPVFSIKQGIIDAHKKTSA